MKIRALAIIFGMLVSMGASADMFDDFFGGDDCPPWEYDCNDWPEWTPMYWMEEMMDGFDDDDDYGYGYGYGPYGGYAPYSYAPYGQPYAPAPVPYAAVPPVQPQAPVAQ